MSAPDRLTAAIQSHNERQAEADRKAATDKQQLESEMHRQNAYRMQWLTQRSILANGVVAVSNRAARENCQYLFMAIPEGNSFPRQSARGHLVAPVPPLRFDVRKSGDQNTIAQLQFSMNVSTGKVVASCSIDGIAMPAPVDVTSVTVQWASQAAENVLVAALQGKDSRARGFVDDGDDDGMRVPD